MSQNDFIEHVILKKSQGEELKLNSGDTILFYAENQYFVATVICFYKNTESNYYILVGNVRNIENKTILNFLYLLPINTKDLTVYNKDIPAILLDFDIISKDEFVLTSKAETTVVNTKAGNAVSINNVVASPSASGLRRRDTSGSSVASANRPKITSNVIQNTATSPSPISPSLENLRRKMENLQQNVSLKKQVWNRTIIAANKIPVGSPQKASAIAIAKMAENEHTQANAEYKKARTDFEKAAATDAKTIKKNGGSKLRKSSSEKSKSKSSTKKKSSSSRKK